MVSTTDVIVEQQSETKNLDSITISDEDFEKAQKTFQLGKKNLILNKFDEAVNNFGDACKIFSIKYGEFDQRCAEIYYCYGKALLELARVENTVLGNALNGVPEDTEPINDSRYGNPEDVAAEEKKEISEKVIDAMCEPEGEAAKPETEAEKIENGTEEKKIESKEEVTAEEAKEEEVKAEEKKEEEKNGEEEAEGEEEEGDEECDEEDEQEDLTKNEEQIKDEAEAEEISNLQRSWEMFELAKLIYSKNNEIEAELKTKRMAECLIKLGEISIEQEIYDQAITDINESIKMQEENKERDERMLAESFYQLGLAYQFNNQFQDANDAYQKSTNILQIRIEKLKGLMEQSTDELEKNNYKDEITELETLLPEMLSKLEEVSEQGQQSMNLIKEAKECFINSITKDGKLAPVPAATDSEVKDITSLVKSKRKISATDEATDSSTKKKKTDDEENGEETKEDITDHKEPNGHTEEAAISNEANASEAIPIETN